MHLYNKYRPSTIDQIAGNTDLKRAITKLMERDTEDFPKVLLFSGPHGCGKTTLAQIIAKWQGAFDPDKPLSHNKNYLELDAAQYTGIDNIRELRRNAEYRAHGGGVRVFTLDEIHRLSSQAQDALLKLLEKPPVHCRFILCTTDPKKLIKTVRSRCMPFIVSPLMNDEMFKLLMRICKAEEKRVPKIVINQIITDAFGSARDAIQILDKIIDLDEDEMLDAAKKQAEIENEIIELCRALLKNLPYKKIMGIIKSLEKQKIDAEEIRRTIRGYMKSVLYNELSRDASEILEEFHESTYTNGFTDIVESVVAVYKSFNPIK